jgi:predicted nuclease of restriction endonuclease-like RecB superfamily
VLTRELVLTRVVKGALRPRFVDPESPALLDLAAALTGSVEAALGQPFDEVEESLNVLAGAAPQPKVSRGLVKLLVDRLEVEPPDAALGEQRWRVFQQAAEARRSLPTTATRADYEAALSARLDLAQTRDQLYADLPGQRALTTWEPVTPRALLDRYNLALAQGPLLQARRLSVRALGPKLLAVRKVLRWLKLCRLVAEVRRDGPDWVLDVEGPAALFAQQKKYGLQLAMFLSAVPLLEHWEARAQLEPLPGRKLRAELFTLSSKDPLVSPLAGAPGHLPEELQILRRGFDGSGWKVDFTPVPRHVGATGLCVPDLALKRGDREVAVELFHPWHAGPLSRRLQELRARPDPSLLLAVDKALEREELEGHAQVVLFRSFPSAKAILAWAEGMEAAARV